MAEIARLRKLRGWIKGKLTRLEAKIDRIPDQVNQEEAETYLAKLEEIQSEFARTQHEINITADGEPANADTQEDADFDERYLELKIKLKLWSNEVIVQQGESRTSTSNEVLAQVLHQQGEILKRMSLQDETRASNTDGDAITRLFEQQTQLLRSIADSSGAASQESRVKLPVAKLPKFDGKTEEWKQFSETFKAMIHSNESIPDVQKFQYLITSLSGSASKIIELTDANYKVAWELLTRRFDDPRSIKKKHIQCLFSMPRVEKESASAIRILVDYTLKHMRVLESLNLPTNTWDELIIHMEAKLDSVTLRAWEQNVSIANPTLVTLTEFLERRCQTLERIEARTKVKEIPRKSEPDKPRAKNPSGEKRTALASVTEAGKCYLCRGDHFMYRCEKFLALPVDERIKEVHRLKLCLNCLRNDHFVKTCKMGSCRECSKRHNTLCHRPADEGSQGVQESNEQTTTNPTSTAALHSTSEPARRRVLMATAVINAVRPNGSTVPLRILLDSASEAHFITHSACNRLGVTRRRATEIVTGLSGTTNVVNQCCEITIQSRCSRMRVNIRSLIIPKITKRLPAVELDRSAFKIPSNIELAVPEFYKQGSIDMLIGAEYFFEWLESEKIELGNSLPTMQRTKVGWIVAGSYAEVSDPSMVSNPNAMYSLSCSLLCSSEQCETLNQALNRFWEIEHYQSNANQARSNEALESDEFFEKTTTRTDDGRFVVRLPVMADPRTLGESREIAHKRLMQLERRFEKDKSLHEKYIEFMRDYIETGHMSPVIESEFDVKRQAVYLPHHGVIKETSTSTKLRVVFDASSKTSSGKSLNDILRVGPTMQRNLIDIIIRFRFYNVALIGDIRKMYRQVLLHPDDRDYQRILWRDSRSEPVQEFRLNTVTYGEASSAYLAIKCIYRLAEEYERDLPEMSSILRNQTYVDDILAGADSIENATTLLEQLTTVLRSGGFETHKWCSNRMEVLNEIPPALLEDAADLGNDADGVIRTLGLKWNPDDDQFQFCVRGAEAARTKREILSAISKLFDPLGLIGPLITTAKIIMQETWRVKREWDEPLPDLLVRNWERFREDLNAAETHIIPRRIAPSDNVTNTYLQGFCDASEKAYGACIYVLTSDEHGVLSSRLLCSKSRVAPIKPISIPRLELCSALLLAHLITNVQRNLDLRIDGVQAWTDSQVALWWIRGDPERWKRFVAHRVAEIIELLPAKHWNHVKGSENPADLISRGATLRQLKESDLWWSGPPWLREKIPSDRERFEHLEPTSEVAERVQAEERRNARVCALISGENQIIQELIDKFSSLTQIERVLAYCLRYISNLRRIPEERDKSRLSASEIRAAHVRLIRYIQGNSFAEEISALIGKRELRSSSKILQLHPFLDEKGVLRVGGRLQHSSWTFERRHPVILPDGNRLSRLLFEREHRRLLHTGQQLLLSSIRERYWPLRGRNLARRTCQECVRCARINPRRLYQVMGSLPGDRVQPSRAFAITGVDFAGPITTLVNKGRGRRTNKSYIALFVCFATKAIHLEATSELTSAAFLATLRRFVGRRGRPSKIYSDNATNFVGANRELKEIYQFVNKQVKGSIGEVLSNEEVEWKFIPPFSPHMGGLWEAGVKSCKHHLKRVMGNVLFTFEELLTALIQIEACLNSRPLSPLSTDPDDLEPLTPAHFLVGESMTSIPDADVTDVAINRLDRWRLIQRVTQDFWKRWAAEYVTTLQGRSKWRKTQANLQIGDLVVLRDENLPPLKWRSGRVVEIHPGKDDLVRVVTVKTASGNFKRPIVKLCKLPVSSCDEEKN